MLISGMLPCRFLPPCRFLLCDQAQYRPRASGNGFVVSFHPSLSSLPFAVFCRRKDFSETDPRDRQKQVADSVKKSYTVL